MEKIHLTLPYAGQNWDFDLCRRPIDMGAAGTIDYWWCDTRQIRRGGDGPAVRTPVELWWAETQRQNLAAEDLADAEANFVLAALFPRVARDRAPQAVLRDAYLPPRRSRLVPVGSLDGDPYDRSDPARDYTLPDEEWSRLRALTAKRDVAAIATEWKSLFIGDLPTPDDLPKYQEAFHRWITNGVVALHTGGRAGLRDYVGKDIGSWIAKYRRGGTLDVKRFVNMVCVEAKVAFTVCYRNAWAKIIPELKHRFGLDARSVRFLGLWHNLSRLDGDRDAFFGMVPALHPLSERIMQQSYLRCVVGNWLVHVLDKPEDNLHATTYWDLLAALLAAGHEYVYLHKRSKLDRPRKLAADLSL